MFVVEIVPDDQNLRYNFWDSFWVRSPSLRNEWQWEWMNDGFLMQRIWITGNGIADCSSWRTLSFFAFFFPSTLFDLAFWCLVFASPYSRACMQSSRGTFDWTGRFFFFTASSFVLLLSSFSFLFFFCASMWASDKSLMNYWNQKDTWHRWDVMLRCDVMRCELTCMYLTWLHWLNLFGPVTCLGSMVLVIVLIPLASERASLPASDEKKGKENDKDSFIIRIISSWIVSWYKSLPSFSPPLMRRPSESERCKAPWAIQASYAPPPPSLFRSSLTPVVRRSLCQPPSHL